MDFLKSEDFNGIIGANTLSDLRGVDDANLNTAEQLAVSELDPLRANFDIDGELAKTNAARSDLLVRILVHITAYYLFNKIEDDDIPERINDNYNNQIKLIEKIAAGKMSTTLDALTDEETGLTKSKYRFGGDTPRDNDIF